MITEKEWKSADWKTRIKAAMVSVGAKTYKQLGLHMNISWRTIKSWVQGTRVPSKKYQLYFYDVCINKKDNTEQFIKVPNLKKLPSLDSSIENHKDALHTKNTSEISMQALSIILKAASAISSGVAIVQKTDISFRFNTYPVCVVAKISPLRYPNVYFELQVTHPPNNPQGFIVKLLGFKNNVLVDHFAATVSDAALLTIVKRLVSSYSRLRKQ